MELKRALFEYVKTDAEVGETYFVWVSAINKAGEGEASEKKQVTMGFSASGEQNKKLLKALTDLGILPVLIEFYLDNYEIFCCHLVNNSQKSTDLWHYKVNLQGLLIPAMTDRYPGLTAMVKHDDDAMSWYNHGD